MLLGQLENAVIRENLKYSLRVAINRKLVGPHQIIRLNFYQ